MDFFTVPTLSLNERHLKRLMSSYLLYYHQDRTDASRTREGHAIKSAYRNSLCA
jgi:hypothetical protein